MTIEKSLLVFCITYSINSFSGIFKCTDANGHIIYSDTACGAKDDRQIVNLATPEHTYELATSSLFSAFTEKLKNLFASFTNRPVSTAKNSVSSAKVSLQRYQCDGRTRCSQMNSCEEATFFINHCPNTEMDGDHDGIPCESQWC